MEGTSLVFAYATVTDNETGDGRYIAGNLLWSLVAKNASTSRSAKTRIVGLVQQAAEIAEVSEGEDDIAID